MNVLKLSQQDDDAVFDNQEPNAKKKIMMYNKKIKKLIITVKKPGFVRKNGLIGKCRRIEGLSKKIIILPSLINNAWRIDVSAKGPSTMANTAGAKG